MKIHYLNMLHVKIHENIVSKNLNRSLLYLFSELNTNWRDLNPTNELLLRVFHVFLHVFILHINFYYKIYM